MNSRVTDTGRAGKIIFVKDSLLEIRRVHVAYLIVNQILYGCVTGQKVIYRMIFSRNQLK